MSGTIVCNGVASPADATLTASLFPDGSDSAAVTGASVSLSANKKFTYSFSTGLTGLHFIQLLNGSTCVWIGWAVLAASGTIEAYDTRKEALLAINSSGQVQFQPGTQSGQLVLNSGQVTVSAVNDKSGYSLAIAPPTTSDIAAAVRDVSNASPPVGSLGARVNTAAGSGGVGPITTSTVIPAATCRAVLQGSTIGITISSTLRVTITDLGNISGRQQLWFTVKRSKNVGDDESLIQITESGGLLRLNGVTAESSSWGSMTVTDEDLGNVDIVLFAEATALLAPRTGADFDFKMKIDSDPDDDVTLMEGNVHCDLPVTLET